MASLSLNTTIQGVKGGTRRTQDAGCALISIENDSLSTLDIFVDIFEGQGETYKKRDVELIEMRFCGVDEFIWKGTAEQLKQLLQYKK